MQCFVQQLYYFDNMQRRERTQLLATVVQSFQEQSLVLVICTQKVWYSSVTIQFVKYIADFHHLSPKMRSWGFLMWELRAKESRAKSSESSWCDEIAKLWFP